MKKFGITKLLFGILLLALAIPMLASRGGEVASVEDEIKWQSDFRLQWSHFKGRPDRNSDMDALTESGITFNWSCDYRGFQVTAYAIFVPTGSWVKDPSSNLLAHEQAHFDITEIHARQLRKFFAETPNPCRLGKMGIDKAAQDIVQASYAMQHTYDVATNHGENFRVQKEWQAKIAAKLAELDAYAE